MTRRIVVLVAVLLLAIAATAAPQAGTGQISGTVQDVTGAVLVGAQVKVTFDKTGATRTVTTSSSGTFVVPTLPVGHYTVEVSYSGFRTHISKEVDVTVSADHVLKITMEPGEVASSVTVSEMAVQVQTSESAVSSLVDGKTLTQLPLNRRNPLHFLGLIPGVTGHSSTATSSSGTVTHNINGDRGRGILTTLDGIDISDPIIPRGELTNAPVNPDMLQEFRVITATPSAQFGRNSGAQVSMVTKSGSNEFHGSAFEFLRNTVLDANSFYNNHLPDPFTKVPPTSREDLKQNQFGGTAGGPIIKDKLFFFGSYEGTRRSQSFLTTSTALTQQARSGLYRFVQGTITIGTTNFTQLSPSLVDPLTGNVLASVPICNGTTITNNCLNSYDIVANDPRALGINATTLAMINKFPLPNDFSAGDGLNTASFSWKAPSQAPADTYAAKIDYDFGPKYKLFGRYTLAWRSHLIGDFINGGLPLSPDTGIGRSRLSRQQSAAVGLTMIPSNTITNSFTAGITRNTLFFADTSHPIRSGDPVFGSVPEVIPASYSTPYIYWGGTERHPEHLQLGDGLSWQRGAHSLRFGGDFRFYRFNNLRNVGSNPQGSGISVFPSVRFSTGVVPFTGISPSTVVANSTDRTRLEAVFNDLLGIIAQVDQIMYSNGSQYVPGNGLVMYQRQREWSGYVQDDWRVNPNLTLNLGLRYEFFGVPYDAGGLQVVPDRPMDQPGVTFLPAGPGRGRDWYTADRNNFAPVAGMAWDPWGKGKTVLRASYRTNYNRLVGWALNVVEQRQPAIAFDPQVRGACWNPTTGVLGACSSGSAGPFVPFRMNELTSIPGVTVVNGLPQLVAPSPNVIQTTPPPTRLASPFFFEDNFKSAMVHQYSLNVQHEVYPNTVVEIGYVGNRGVNLFRFLNVNQVELYANGFLQEFINAKNNLAICRANQVACRTAAGSTSTTFASFGNLLPASGTVPVPLFSALFSATGAQNAAGFSNSTSIGSVDTNSIGVLGNAMDRAGQQGSRGPLVAFGNDSFFRPNPQFDVAGLGASNSKSWYNSLQLQIKGSYRWGLQMAANYTWQKSIDDQSDETVGAGTGFSFPFDSKNVKLSKARSDFDVNHAFRAYAIYDLPFGKGKKWGSNWAGWMDQILGGWQLNTIIDMSSGFPFTPSSASSTQQYFITSPADCDPTARRFASLNKHDSRGGVWFFPASARTTLFKIPAPGRLGSCGRNTFTGPPFSQTDLGISKSFRVTEKMKLDFRTEMFNAFNQANFSNPSTTSIQSTNFGKITSTRAPNRIMQFALKLVF